MRIKNALFSLLAVALVLGLVPTLSAPAQAQSLFGADAARAVKAAIAEQSAATKQSMLDTKVSWKGKNGKTVNGTCWEAPPTEPMCRHFHAANSHIGSMASPGWQNSPEGKAYAAKLAADDPNAIIVQVDGSDVVATPVPRRKPQMIDGATGNVGANFINGQWVPNGTYRLPNGATATMESNVRAGGSINAHPTASIGTITVN